MQWWTSRNTPQNGWVDIWVMRFHFRASIKPIFENHVFRAVSGPFHPLYETKISNRWLSVVYGSITLKFFSGALGTSPHQWFNRGNEIQTNCFLGHHIEYWPCFKWTKSTSSVVRKRKHWPGAMCWHQEDYSVPEIIAAPWYVHTPWQSVALSKQTCFSLLCTITFSHT